MILLRFAELSFRCALRVLREPEFCWLRIHTVMATSSYSWGAAFNSSYIVPALYFYRLHPAKKQSLQETRYRSVVEWLALPNQFFAGLGVEGAM